MRRILLSGLVSYTYRNFLQTSIRNGDKFICLLNNPSPLTAIKIPFVIPPHKNTGNFMLDYTENFKTAAKNKDFFVYFLHKCSEDQMKHYLEALELYLSELPETIVKNVKIMYEHSFPSFRKNAYQKQINVDIENIISLFQLYNAQGTILTYPSWSGGESIYEPKKTVHESIEQWPLKALYKDAESSKKEFGKAVSTQDIINSIIDDQNYRNSVVHIQSKLIDNTDKEAIFKDLQ